MPTAPQVLAVVSEPYDLATLVSEFRATGIELTFTDNLLEAVLYQLNDEAPVVVCDADCFDWILVLDLMRRLAMRTRVVFFTRVADERLWLDMLDAGAYDLLEKPWRGQDLRWVVGSALKSATAAFARVARSA